MYLLELKIACVPVNEKNIYIFSNTHPKQKKNRNRFNNSGE